jgi:hypothetical protein
MNVLVPQDQRIPTEDTGVPPPPQGQGTRRGRGVRIAFFGCGGLIGLFLLLVIAVALSDDQDTTTAQKEEPAKEKKEEKKEKRKEAKGRESAVGVGQPVDVGEVQWTATNVTRTGQLSQERFGQFGETKQGDFVVADLLFTNNGNEPAAFTTNSIALLDANNREFRPDTDTFGYIGPQRNILLEQVNPGVTQEGTVIFSVPPDAAGFVLRLEDARVFGNQTGCVNGGF